MADDNIARLTYEWPAGTEETEDTRDGFNASVLRDLQSKGPGTFKIFYSGFPNRDPDTEETADVVRVNEDGSVETVDDGVDA